MKRVTLRTPNEDEVTFIGERSNHLSNVISAATARKMVRKGCEAYLAYVIDTVKARPSVSDIPIVSDFSDVIEFAIDVVLGATPASITPYRMAPAGLKELKLYLQARNKISVIMDISVLGFYGNIGNIIKYRWIF